MITVHTRTIATPYQVGKTSRPAPAKVSMVLSLLVLALCCLCAGCASTGNGASQAASPFGQVGDYALDGPDLLVVGDLSGLPLQGTMQRKVMVGVGKLKLSSTEAIPSLICESVVNAQPTEKRRVRGILDCNDGSIILFTLRPLGPDQGLGIGTAHSPDTPPASATSSQNTGPLALNASSPDAPSEAPPHPQAPLRPAVIPANHDAQTSGNTYLTIFYHPSLEEAERRFPQILSDFTKLRQEKRL